MASGLGRRFGGNKLLADLGGRPLIAYILDATEGLFTARVVVTRHAGVRALCESRGIPVALHALPHRSDTVRLGLEHLAQAVPDLTGCLFCTGDQPLVTRGSLEALLQAAANEPWAIHRLAFGGQPGSPVLFPACDFDALRRLPMGKGGGVLLKKHPDRVRLVQAGAAHELWDADTPDDLEKIAKYV